MFFKYNFFIAKKMKHADVVQVLLVFKRFMWQSHWNITNDLKFA